MTPPQKKQQEKQEEQEKTSKTTKNNENNKVKDTKNDGITTNDDNEPPCVLSDIQFLQVAGEARRVMPVINQLSQKSRTRVQELQSEANALTGLSEQKATDRRNLKMKELTKAKTKLSKLFNAAKMLDEMTALTRVRPALLAFDPVCPLLKLPIKEWARLDKNGKLSELNIKATPILTTPTTTKDDAKDSAAAAPAAATPGRTLARAPVCETRAG